MKFLILSTLIPGIICAAVGPKDSPLRKNIHSKSVGEMPQVSGLETASQAIPISRPTRSSSELEFQTDNMWASPPSSSFSPPTNWTTSKSLHTIKPKVATHRPRRLTPAELGDLKEKQWRALRRKKFGPTHKRTNSLPSCDEVRELSFLMELSEQYGDMKQLQYKSALIQQQAIATQQQYIDSAGKAGALLSLMETSNFEDLFKQTVKLSCDLKKEIARQDEAAHAQEARYEEIMQKMNNLVSHVTKLTARLDLVFNASMGEPTSPRSSTDSSRSSVDKDRRSRSNGSFLGSLSGSLGFGHKE